MKMVGDSEKFVKHDLKKFIDEPTNYSVVSWPQ